MEVKILDEIIADYHRRIDYLLNSRATTENGEHLERYERFIKALKKVKKKNLGK